MFLILLANEPPQNLQKEQKSIIKCLILTLF